MADPDSYDRGLRMGRLDGVSLVNVAHSEMLEPLPYYTRLRFGGADVIGVAVRVTLFVFPRDGDDLRDILDALDEAPTVANATESIVTLQVAHPRGVYVICAWLYECQDAGIDVDALQPIKR